MNRKLRGSLLVIFGCVCWGLSGTCGEFLFNEKAYKESYNVATSEHHSWEEIAKMYNELCPFKYIEVSTEDYLNILGPGVDWVKYQLIYARMFERITDNTKVLEATGMKQEELMTLFDGLKLEFERSKDFDWDKYATHDRNVRMDEYLANYKGE